jgi:hypothetical protein
VARSCEYCSEPSGSVKSWEFRQRVLQVVFLSACRQFYCMLVFAVFHYMFRPTWPSSSV